jgi:aminoglycoside phosphotransferase (APT) family kinase protein
VPAEGYPFPWSIRAWIDGETATAERIGDPACDVAIAWKLPTAESRQAFREALAVDPAMWARARGWALWKALITLSGERDLEQAGGGGAARLAAERRTLQTILSEYARRD